MPDWHLKTLTANSLQLTACGQRTCERFAAGYDILLLEDTVTELLKRATKTYNAHKARRPVSG
jgi:hypothetical protein